MSSPRAATAAALLATTTRVDAPADLLDALGPDGFAWVHDGAGFVTAGVAARLAPRDAGDLLSNAVVDDPVGRPGTGVVAVGALPFADPASGALVVPARVTGVAADGTAWRTDIVAAPGVHDLRAVGHRAVAAAAPPDRAAWRRAVAAVLDEIESGRVAKVVLAREVVIEDDARYDARLVLDRLRHAQPGCFVYGRLDDGDDLVGASPELLVRRAGERVESRPMAGTIARGATTDEDERAVRALATSTKDALEHRLVVTAVVDALRPRCRELRFPAHPEVARLASLAHLTTPVIGRLRPPWPSALDLALVLHPTPAVCGTPPDAALALSRDHERFDRGRYAGPVGWVDAAGDGEWAVALRGAELHGSRARLVVGSGIVAGSDPDAEWEETEAKLETMLSVLRGR